MRICPKVTPTLLSLTLVACVDTAPRRTGEDTGERDTVVDTSVDTTADAAEVSNDLVEPDGADTGPEPDGTTSDGSTGDVVGTCGTSADCDDLPVGTCEVPFCDDGTCVAVAAESATCDDGNPCTHSDFCDQGQCAGVPITCDDLAPDCWITSEPGAACVPFVGCPGTAFPAGSQCDNGAGPEGGTCMDGWRVPSDACDGAGMCVDTGFAPPSATLHPLAGTWHVVVSSAPSDAPLHTLRGILTFAQGGDLGFDQGVSTNPVWLDDFAGEADFCAGGDGVVDLALGEHAYRGFADPEAGLVVFGGLEDDQALGVAVRPTGLPEEVDGTYHLISTALFGAGETAPLITWQGTIDLQGGCVKDGGTLATSPGLGAAYTFVGGQGRCLVARGGGLYQLGFGLRVDPESPPFDIFWVGSIGARGDVLLFTREDGGLRYGTILLVRDRAPASLAELTGSWGFASQWNGAGAGDEAQDFFDHRLDLGVLDLGLTTSSVGGFLLNGDASATVGPGWWQPGTSSARYYHRLSFGGVALAHTGWIAPSGDLIVAWRALDPSTPNTPSVLGITPAEGSLFVAVRRNTFDASGSGATPR